MKTQLLLAVLLGLSLSACSSSSKKEMNDTQEKVEANADKTADKKTEDTQKADADTKEAVTGEKKCTMGKDVRTIGIKQLENGGCEVIYNKFGEATSIASGSKGSDHCANVVKKVSENLENAGFKCE